MGFDLRLRNVSGVKILSTLCITVPLICIFVYLIATHNGENLTKNLGPIDKLTVNEVLWDESLPIDRTGFVYTFYSQGSDSDQRLVSTLVSIQALKLTVTLRDIIVIVDNEISSEQKNSLKSSGAKIHQMGSDGLFTAHNRALLGECIDSFMPITAWSLSEQYDRLVWIDHATIPQLNIDELFLCGNFCMPYMTSQSYRSSLFVLKPDNKQYLKLLESINSSNVLSSLSSYHASFIYSPSTCFNIFSTFIVSMYPELSMAPVFDPRFGQSTQDISKLSLGYCISHELWYFYYNWSLARLPNYMKFNSEEPSDIPGHMLCYSRPTPSLWFATPLLTVNKVWNTWYTTLLPVNHFTTIILVLLLSFIIYMISSWRISIIFTLLGIRNSVPSVSITHFQHHPNGSFFGSHYTSGPYRIISGWYQFLRFCGLVPMAWILSTLFTVIVSYLSYLIIPSITVYTAAWPLFIVILSISQYSLLLWVSTIVLGSIGGVNTLREYNAMLSSKSSQNQNNNSGYTPVPSINSPIPSSLSSSNFEQSDEVITINSPNSNTSRPMTQQQQQHYQHQNMLQQQQYRPPLQPQRPPSLELDVILSTSTYISQNTLFSIILKLTSIRRYLLINMLYLSILYIICTVSLFSSILLKIFIVVAGIIGYWYRVTYPIAKIIITAYYSHHGKIGWRPLSLAQSGTT